MWIKPAVDSQWPETWERPIADGAYHVVEHRGAAYRLYTAPWHKAPPECSTLHGSFASLDSAQRAADNI